MAFCRYGCHLYAVPVVLLAPYLPLREQVDVGPWRLVPFAQSEEVRYLSDGIAADARLLIDAYRVEGARLGALVTLLDAPVGRDVDPDDVGPLHRALLLGVLESNPDRPADPTQEPDDLNIGHRTAAAENTLVYGHPVRGDGTFATQTGFMAPFLAIHGRIQPDDRIRIRPPGELPTPIMATDLDADYASAALAVMTAGDETARRVSRAAEWLDVSWQNTSGVGHDARILALRCGFEVLLSTTEFGDDTRQIGEALSDLLDEADAARVERSWQQRGRVQRCELTDLEWWFQCFTLLRNAIAHGHPVGQANWAFNDGRLHLFVGESTLRRALKRTVARAGHAHVEDDLFMRTFRRYVREHQQPQPDGDSV